MKFALPTFLTSLLLVGTGFSTVQIEYGIGWTPGVADGSIGVFVVDTAGDGFAGIDSSTSFLLGAELTAGSFFGADDLILEVGSAKNFGTFGFSELRNGIELGGGVDAGDALAVYWFDAPAGGTVGAGQTGGFFRSELADVGTTGDFGFRIPADGASVKVFGFSEDFGGLHSNAAFEANNFVVVPEPSAGLLLGLSSVALLLRRRRK